LFAYPIHDVGSQTGVSDSRRPGARTPTTAAASKSCAARPIRIVRATSPFRIAKLDNIAALAAQQTEAPPRALVSPTTTLAGRR
jgi:hypothetical protein